MENDNSDKIYCVTCGKDVTDGNFETADYEYTSGNIFHFKNADYKIYCFDCFKLREEEIAREVRCAITSNDEGDLASAMALMENFEGAVDGTEVMNPLYPEVEELHRKFFEVSK